MKLSGNTGYRGFCTLDNTPLLCTGGNINLSQNPIMGTGVWGAGYMNNSKLTYAWDSLSLDGDIEFQVTTGNAWRKLMEFVFYGKGNVKKIKFFPNNAQGYIGGGIWTSFTAGVHQGQAVKGSVSFKGNPDPNPDSDDVFKKKIGICGQFQCNQPTIAKAIDSTYCGEFAGHTLVPYWACSLFIQNKSTTIYSSAIRNVVSFSCSCDTPIEFFQCCKNLKEVPLSPQYLIFGQSTATGNYSIFTCTYNCNDNPYHFEQGKHKSTFFKFKNVYLYMPISVLLNTSMTMVTGTNYVVTQVNIKGISDGKLDSHGNGCPLRTGSTTSISIF